MTFADDAHCRDAISPHLTALADGELSGETADALRAHLAACAACARTFQEIVAVGRLAREANALRRGDGAAGRDDVWAALRAQIAPASNDTSALQKAVTELHDELRAARADIAALRAEVADLRGRPTIAPPVRAAPQRLFPYASPTDPPLRLT